MYRCQDGGRHVDRGHDLRLCRWREVTRGEGCPPCGNGCWKFRLSCRRFVLGRTTGSRVTPNTMTAESKIHLASRTTDFVRATTLPTFGAAVAITRPEAGVAVCRATAAVRGDLELGQAEPDQAYGHKSRSKQTHCHRCTDCRDCQGTPSRMWASYPSRYIYLPEGSGASYSD